MVRPFLHVGRLYTSQIIYRPIEVRSLCCFYAQISLKAMARDFLQYFGVDFFIFLIF